MKGWNISLGASSSDHVTQESIEAFLRKTIGHLQIAACTVITFEVKQVPECTCRTDQSGCPVHGELATHGHA